MQPDFHLSPEEAALVENSAWIITKQRIIGKVYGLFGLLSEKYSGILEGYSEFIPSEVMHVSPKIYKGEMYRQLPYVMLDHPRFFEQTNVFAIRSFFWWGNHFSIHLVLGGKYNEMFSPVLNKHVSEGSLDDWYIGIGDDPWEHHFESDNYVPVHEWRIDNANLPGNYLKLGKHFSLEYWKDASPFFINSYTKLLECFA